MGVFDFFKKKADETAAPAETSATEQSSAQAKPDESTETTLDQSLEKTKTGFFSRIGKALVGKSTVDADFLDDLEEALVAADLGVQTTIKVINRLEARAARDKYFNTAELNRILREEIIAILSENKQYSIPDFNLKNAPKPYIIMVVGVNGVGKTTTIGKLAHQFKKNGKNVILGAADTFRAAAVDQLTIWSERVDVPIVSRGMGADPAAVAFDTVQSAVAKGADVAIIDTAGRLQNKVGLMNELSKIKNVMAKVIPDAPHEILLVLDASTGQNAVEQAKQFMAATDVNAMALTKLDGTAKGGVVISIADQFKIPVKYIGLGEKIDDLKPFDKVAFINSLFKD
jgi:fused signal recognition particle receptor